MILRCRGEVANRGRGGGYLPHPLHVMDEIVAAVKGKVEIIVDGGFRRGSDVLKGLAFGASLVGLGRPILYALAVGGKKA